MSGYNFENLSDEDFEELVNDLLSEVLSMRLERFSKGRDKGIDGRILMSSDKAIIVQSKHYRGSKYSDLKSNLKHKEVAKAFSLNPHRYILATSLDLSVGQKQEISQLFGSHLNEKDIYTKKDINALLKKYPQIERSHYKLWLSSSNILKHLLDQGIYTRSKYKLIEIRESVNLYVKTCLHTLALEQLKNNHCLLINGNAGVGKSTLAEQLCNEYVSNEYQFIEIKKDFESVWKVLEEDTKQIFYFDDFFGSNYLREIKNDVDSEIVKFIKAICRNSSGVKKLIITSRTSILNQGIRKSAALGDIDFDLDKILYNVKLEKLSNTEKARILRNHLYFKLLPTYMNSVVKDDFYFKIIDHENYNPRVISALTNTKLLGDTQPDEYQDYVMKRLIDLEYLWQHPFEQNLDEAERNILYLLVLNVDPVPVYDLERQYRFYTKSIGKNCGDIEFSSCLTTVCGAFVTRKCSENSDLISIANPSITDFIINRFRKSAAMLLPFVLAVNDTEALYTLREMEIAENEIKTIANGVLNTKSDEYPKYAGLIISCIEFLGNYSPDHNDYSEALNNLDLDVFLYSLFETHLNGSVNLDVDTIFMLCLASIKSGKVKNYATVISLFEFIDHEDYDAAIDMVLSSSIINSLDQKGIDIKDVKKDWEYKILKYLLKPQAILSNTLEYYELEELIKPLMLKSYVQKSLATKLEELDCNVAFTDISILDKTDWDAVESLLRNIISENQQSTIDDREYDRALIDSKNEKSASIFDSSLSPNDVFQKVIN